MQELWLALGLGFLGSLHCVGMCGPLVLALPRWHGDAGQFAKLASGRVLYNVGRVTTYVLFGLLLGVIGSAARFSGLQQVVSLLSGSLILLWLFLPKRVTENSAVAKYSARLNAQVRRVIMPVLQRNPLSAQFGLGLLNGLLPCGLVYVALAGALAQTSILNSGAFMLLFGLGTFPAMLFLALVSGSLKPALGTSVRRLMPVGMALVAVLLILRGLSLGIPYVSPILKAPAHVAGAASDAMDAAPHSCH